MRFSTALTIFSTVAVCAALALPQFDNSLKTCPSFLDFCKEHGQSYAEDPDFVACERLYSASKNTLQSKPQTGRYQQIKPNECQTLTPIGAGDNADQIWFARGEGDAVCKMYEGDNCTGKEVDILTFGIPKDGERYPSLLGNVRSVWCESCQ